MYPNVDQMTNFLLMTFLFVMASGLVINALLKRPAMNWPAWLCGLWAITFLLALLGTPWGTFEAPKALGAYIAAYFFPALFAFVGAKYWREKHVLRPMKQAAGSSIELGCVAGETADGFKKSEPIGIGGWLILLAFAVVVNPVRQVVAFQEISAYYEPQLWSEITTPGTQVYHPLFGAGINISAGFNIMLMLGGFYCAYLFFKKKKDFIKFYPLLLLLMCGAVLFDCHY